MGYYNLISHIIKELLTKSRDSLVMGISGSLIILTSTGSPYIQLYGETRKKIISKI